MPDRPPLLRRLPLIALAALAGCAHLPPAERAERPFVFATDRFAFANETVWNYVGGEIRPGSERADAGRPRYQRHCFVVSRAAVQFWKFARYAPDRPPLPPEELACRIRQVARRDVWADPLPRAERIVFPGYADLHRLSAAHADLFEANLGAGWPIYFRFGNHPMIFPAGAAAEARYHEEIDRDLRQKTPTILWLYNFPRLDINHAVVAYASRRDGARTVYAVYDPNYEAEPKRLAYDPATRRFSYEATFYFKGGPVTARPVYRGVFQ